MDIKEIKLNFTLSNQIKQKSVYPSLAYCSVRNKVGQEGSIVFSFDIQIIIKKLI
jgi:hypothetical protein